MSTDEEKVHRKAAYLRDFVFAASDGIVTTFAIVSGSTGADLGRNVVLILGFANLFADGVSMAVGNYLGVKSESEFEISKNHKDHKRGSPLSHGLVTFVSFNLAGLFPLLPYLFFVDNNFKLSCILVGITLFTVGSIRTVLTKESFIRSGIEMLVAGSAAALIAYFVGSFLRGLVG